MYVDRQLLERLRKDIAIKRNSAQGNSDISSEIAKIIPLIENHVTQSNVEKASNWMLFQDSWLQNESGNLRASTSYRNYTRGRIIMSIDWGTSNIGTEIRYPHPGVVLYDQDEDWVIAAPITAARINQQTNQPIAVPPFEVLAFKQNNPSSDPNEYWFRKHSVIQVDQIQRISKYRVVNKKSYRIKENLLKQIDNLILEYFIPGKHAQIEKLKETLLGKNEELMVARAEIEKLKLEIEQVKSYRK